MPSKPQETTDENDERAKNLASFFHLHRKQTGQSPKDLAIAVGVSEATYMSYEKGAARGSKSLPAMPRFDVALLIIKELGCRVEDAGSAMGIDLNRQPPARAEIVRKARRDRHWSEQELADELGITLRGVRAFESGTVPVPNSVIEAIAYLPVPSLPIPGTVPDDVLEDEADRLASLDGDRKASVGERRGHGERHPRRRDDA